MALANPLIVAPPEECSHAQPVQGVMAHEFAHYEAALGPEGARRTVTYYGPVIGGLPISAWHCEDCGLLRMAFPDGRREERRLFPGPQPGLLALPSVVAPDAVNLGRQPRVSGLSAPLPMYQDLYDEELGGTPWRRPHVEIPVLGFLAWTNVLGLAALCLGLLVAAVIAVAGDSVPQGEAPVVVTLGAIFGVLVVMNAASPAWRKAFPMPPLSPSVAVTARGKPVLDPWDGLAIALFVFAAIALLVAAVLATYTYNVSGLTLPVFALAMLSGLGAVVSLTVGSLSRRSRRP